VEETKQFPTIERRRNPAQPGERREAGEVAVFQELGKALTSSLQLDQVLRTIMEKIDEFLRPDNWSLLLLDEAKQELVEVKQQTTTTNGKVRMIILALVLAFGLILGLFTLSPISHP
jgi:GAF domain-containing protein